jgi:hypothetical protein
MTTPRCWLWSSFRSDLFSGDPTLRRVMSDYTAHAFLRHIVASRKVVGTVARFVCDVLAMFDSVEFVPEGFRI